MRGREGQEKARKNILSVRGSVIVLINMNMLKLNMRNSKGYTLFYSQ